MAINLDGAEERPVEADAHAVLLPEIDHLRVADWARSFLASGGRALLLGLSPDEYDARQVSEIRRRREDQADIRAFCADFREAVDGAVIVAIDAESGGVHRLEHLLPPTPTSRAAVHLTDAELGEVFANHAAAARGLGVTMFLGPVVDIVTGTNPWLSGRTMIDDDTRTASTAALYVHAAQRAGIVAAAKYFPGHPDLIGDPAREVVTLTIDQDEVVRNLVPFQRMVAEGVPAIVLGPVTATAIDPDWPAPTSKVLVDLLRCELGFRGLIVSDQLDVPSTTVNGSLAQVAVAAIRAGVQLLRVPGGDTVTEIASGLAAAVHDGTLSRSRLARAADAVRGVAGASNACTECG